MGLLLAMITLSPTYAIGLDGRVSPFRNIQGQRFGECVTAPVSSSSLHTGLFIPLMAPNHTMKKGPGCSIADLETTTAWFGRIERACRSVCEMENSDQSFAGLLSVCIFTSSYR
jgi:hypothetical protein